MNQGLKFKIKKKTFNLIRKKSFLLDIFKKINNLKRNKNYLYFNEKNILIQKYKSIYFPVPKAASSSIKKYISEILGIKGLKKFRGKFPEYHHLRNYPFVKRKNLSKKYKNYFKFTFVRNPHARVVSCYEHWIKKATNPNISLYKEFRKNMSFEEFVKALSKIPDNASDGHFRSQHTFITDKKGNLLVDFIGKVEHINRDFKKVCEKTGMSYKKLSRINKKTNKNYKKYYDKETKKLIQKRYKKDFELFGYKF